MNKLTDAEIVKALEMCNDKKGKCTDCPIYQHSARCISVLVENAFDLINRQKAEIERYKKVVGELTISEDGESAILLDDHTTEYIKKDLHKIFMTMARKQSRAEAIKEFAERLKTETFLAKAKGSVEHVLWIDEIDNLVKEMVGDIDV